jgi:uncharacterized repeat protein (TIGR01451 family)
MKKASSNRINLRWVWSLLALVILAISFSGLRTAVAQSTDDLETTFKELGYDQRQLEGPVSSVTYHFSLPANWEPQDGSYVQLDLDYVTGEQDSYPTALLEVRLNGELLHTENLESQGVQIVSVDIPPDRLISAEAESLNSLGLDFVVNEESEQDPSVSLIVNASSLLHLVYQQGSWQPDLALYPMPIYQEQTFQPGDVHFILPSEPSSADLRAAVMIAARLGRLTSARLPISATLASDLSPDTLPDTHLIIVGRPDDNPLIRDLDLPISLAERRLAIHSQMPVQVKPGDTISYTLVVDNTSDATQSVAVEDRLPAEVEWLACSGECEEIGPGVVRWEIGSLVPGDSVSTVFSVRVDELVPPDATIEHTASLVDDDGEVLNVDTLSTQVGTATSGELVASKDEESDYFWVHLDQGVAEKDGLVQEIVSPSNPGRVAIVATGLDEEGVLKAAQALGSDTEFVGMSGEYAIVQVAQAIPEMAARSSEDIPVASLGYAHLSIDDLHREYLDYYFDFPPGWNLGADASLAVHIAHSVALNDIATLDVRLTDVPVGSVHLDESNAHDSWIVLPLPATLVRAGSNRVQLQVNADIEDVHQLTESDRYWLTVYSDTFFHLPRETAGLTLDLESFPEPFNSHPTLEDVVFILPEAPTLTEIEGVLRLAHRLGIVTGGDAFWPQVAIGGKPDTEPWADHHLIAVGRPTRNPYIAAAGDALPQPFRPGTDEIAQEIDHVVYRTPSGVSLGYVQELVSPWNEDRAMLAVTGTTDEGVGWALVSLTDSEFIWRLSGNLALIRDQEVRSMDTRRTAPEVVAAVIQGLEPGLVTSATSTLVPTVTPPPSLSTTPTVPEPDAPAPIVSEVASSVGESGRPEWLIPLLIASALVVVLSVGFAIWQARS